MAQDPSEASGMDLDGLLLPENGIVELTDKLTGYMTEIELGGLSDIIGQVLDDFLDQCGGMPEDLNDSTAFDQITRNQLAVTLAYQLGRLDGRSPQVVNLLVQQAIDSFGVKRMEESSDISDEDFQNPKELVYPRLRRLEYVEPPPEDE
ncbi:MAG: hypothetical protein CL755_14455 [Chloroflexi bacterium]|jgi:hypothetical protein|nr:hypothetical protein [Chloroflexota bacterium]MCH2536312.1 hypothetical protein [Dehalococcoidia bacterium]MEE2925836.1 hypothetical protein [Chloroflexota bacterium]HIB10830.1 hypothetical protein [Dehalococcoidia bacterium]HIM49489.1 hypothetical protein [Dehalococcoidia bacterium]|tara:strand:- start:828 stop:1274 length:447 start_codon:yes stop_codon:yes gene_type:complete